MSKPNRWVRDPATLRPGSPKSANEFVMPPTPQVEVRYLTDPATYEAVLPPPLRPAAEPRVHIGNLHNEQGKWEEAIAAYEDALRVRPDHVIARFNLAGSLANAGRLEEAVEVLEKAPNDERCRQRLAQIRQMMAAQR